MTTLPLKSKRLDGQWWIVDKAGEREAGPYDSKKDAEDDRLGLTRFYTAHPDYCED